MEFKEIVPDLDRRSAVHACLSLLEWDSQTLAPPEGEQNREKIAGSMAAEYYAIVTDEETMQKIRTLLSARNKKKLTAEQIRILEVWKAEAEKMQLLSEEEYRRYQEEIQKSLNAWAKARKASDFSLVQENLAAVVEWKRTIARRSRKGREPLYNALLREYEPDFLIKELEVIFRTIKKEIVPRLREEKERQKKEEKPESAEIFPLEEQRKWMKRLAEHLGWSQEYGVIGESLHPFTLALHNRDVRMTVHYDEKNLPRALFALLHECGHSLYEAGIRDDITRTPVGKGATMAVHESQSRFYENMIGRRRSFWEPLFGELQKSFPKQLAGGLDEFLTQAGRLTFTPVRVDADELTYPVHILIRYELERDLINGKIQVKHLPERWKEVYQAYLGIEIQEDAEGILSDIHWYGGQFGYFPSYLLGSAMAAQIWHRAETLFPADQWLREGNLNGILAFLRSHIHQYGALKTTGEILLDTTEEPFRLQYYLDDWMEKFYKISNAEGKEEHERRL